MDRSTSIDRDLEKILGRGCVLPPGDRAPYESDQTGRFHGTALTVVAPRSVEEVVAVVDHCRADRIPLVPQGGNTGLVGGSAPFDAVVMSLRRIDHARYEGMCLEAGAGTTLGAAQSLLGPFDKEIPIDLAARDSATLGGMLATDAGGARSFRRGRMGTLVASVTAVVATGDVVEGDEALQLTRGMEGTLAIAVELVVITHPRPGPMTTVLAGESDLAHLIQAVEKLAHSTTTLEVAEYLTAKDLRSAGRMLGLPLPDPAGPHLCLMDLACDSPEELEELLQDATLDELIVAGPGAQRADLWRARDSLNELVQQLGPPLKLDVTIPSARLPQLLADLDAIDGDAHVFGHLLQGHVHINILGVEDDSRSVISRAVLVSVVTHGGNVVGEHGVGRAKREWLTLGGNEDALARFEMLKSRHDPAGIMNPGVAVPVYTSD